MPGQSVISALAALQLKAICLRRQVSHVGGITPIADQTRDLNSRDDVRHQISVDPPHVPNVHVGDVEQGRRLWVPCSAFGKQDVTHHPISFLLDRAEIGPDLPDADRHACFD